MSATHSDPVDLAGPWLLRHDPGDTGLSQRWFEKPPEGGWTPGGVNAPWQKHLGVDVNGVVWYRTTLPQSSSSKPADRLWLFFESIATACRIWVNGQEVGGNVGDFVPFIVEVSDAVHAAKGPCELIIRVDQIFAPRPAPGVLTENGHLTKGFHDVLSVQHAGIWGKAFFAASGPLVLATNGVHITAHPATGTVDIRADLHEPAKTAGELRVTIDGQTTTAEISAGATAVNASLRIKSPKPWSPESPTLYSAGIELWANAAVSDSADIRFGFRTVTTGGEGNTRILLNGKPILLRGVLHWGHEPQHISPAPTPEEILVQFKHLRECGFNCVCLCMVYLPAYFYDIADETGMLLWQEHPIWKSDMALEHLTEYQRLCTEFFRRDRNHASIILVSGSCEHEGINPALAEWWWKESKHHHPQILTQIQTAFTAWTNPAQTDTHDEHVYDNSGRWPAFLSDIRAEVKRLGSKPFTMGETVIANAWPDIAALRKAFPDSAAKHNKPDERWTQVTPWYLTRGLDECEAFEHALTSRYGLETLTRFRGQAEKFGIEFRRWQIEQLRTDPGIAGWVMNHIRDVPLCRCGFMDDLDRWRYPAANLHKWLGDATLLLRTPDSKASYSGGAPISISVGVSNFGATPIGGTLSLKTELPLKDKPAALTANPGNVGWSGAVIQPAAVTSPTRVRLAAECGPLTSAWDLWLFPPPPEFPPDVVRLDGLPYSKAELEPTFEERGYSSGWGLKCQSWKPTLPDLSRLAFKCPLVRFDAPLPEGTKLVLTNRLTRSLIDFANSGGRVVLLASRAEGGLNAKMQMLWGQVPLIIDDAPWWQGRGPLTPGDSAWALDLLHHDLNRKSQFAVPSDELGLADSLDPIIRYIFTHDSGKPRMFDALAWARIGKGVLTISALDHHDIAGQWLLHQILTATLDANKHAGPDRSIVASTIMPFCVR